MSEATLEAEAAEEGESSGMGLMVLASLGVLSAVAAIFLYAPTEKTEGAVQRIMYFHVPCAWLAFFAFFVVFACSILFLWKKEREWDIYAHASAEIGIVFCTLVLITGPIWGKAVWGVWWVWDARLTSTLVLWLIYVAYLMLRMQSEPGSTRARYAAVIGIVGFLDIPLIHFSVLWWRTFHPLPKFVTTSGLGAGMDNSMTITLMISLGAFTLLYFLLMSQRVRIEKMKDDIDRIKKKRLYAH